MKPHDRLWNDLNSLLASLRDFKAIDLVDAHFARRGNEVPAHILRDKIATVQQHLNRAEASTSPPSPAATPED